MVTLVISQYTYNNSVLTHLEHKWQAMGKPTEWRLVEVGPGRGTLMSDLLRGTSASKTSKGVFDGFRKGIREVNLVEISPLLAKIQAENLGCDKSSFEKMLHDNGGTLDIKSNEDAEKSSLRLFSDKHETTFAWHSELASVPQDMPEIIIMHELFDALPVHQFVKANKISVQESTNDIAEDVNNSRDKRMWRERLIDVVHENDILTPHHFRFVLSPGPTPASYTILERRLKMMTAREENSVDTLTGLEVCPRAIALVEDLALRASKTGGASLIIDYGSDKPISNSSLRGIRKHEFVHPLSMPGVSDLSCGVDFSALSDAVENLKRQSKNDSEDREKNIEVGNLRSSCYGPITQSAFFLSMGIIPRMEQLGRNAKSDKQIEDIRRGFIRLVGSDPGLQEEDKSKKDETIDKAESMGNSYLCFAISADGIGKPAGF